MSVVNNKAEVDASKKDIIQTTVIDNTISATSTPSSSSSPLVGPPLPQGFVDLKDVDPTILHSLRYINAENFTGVPVPGYTTSRVVVSEVLAAKLKLIQAEFAPLGYSLVVYDSYRPKKAIEHFWQWSQRGDDLLTADKYYPTFKKRKPVLFEKVYIARKSNHNRGSTLDVTLIPLTAIQEGRFIKERVLDLQWRDLHKVAATITAASSGAAGASGEGGSTGSATNEEEEAEVAERKYQSREDPATSDRLLPYMEDGTLDMGTSVDLLDLASGPDAPLELVPEPFHSRRQLLRRAFEKQGFTVSEREWWHYWLNNGEETFPPESISEQFDFDI